jgi:membrane protease YdiL (CAAX protease family)
MKRSPAVIFFAFFLALASALVAAAVLAPVVQELLAPIKIFALHRVFNRIAMLGVLVITTLLLIYYRAANRRLLGYYGPWPQFFRRGVTGFLAGLVLMSVALVPLFLLDLREFNDRLPHEDGPLFLMVIKAILSGLVVALIEESFFRGAMQGALMRQGATALALFAVPVIYSSVHFLGKAVRIPYEQVHADSGFDVLASYFVMFHQPSLIWDAFITLYLVGVLLAIVRYRWGDLAGCLGLHAGFVAVIMMFRKVSSPGDDTTWAFLVGASDGLLGLWISVMTGLSCLLVWKLRAAKNAS